MNGARACQEQPSRPDARHDPCGVKLEPVPPTRRRLRRGRARLPILGLPSPTPLARLAEELGPALPRVQPTAPPGASAYSNKAAIIPASWARRRIPSLRYVE
jgi:hypothetical protein